MNAASGWAALGYSRRKQVNEQSVVQRCIGLEKLADRRLIFSCRRERLGTKSAVSDLRRSTTGSSWSNWRPVPNKPGADTGEQRVQINPKRLDRADDRNRDQCYKNPYLAAVESFSFRTNFTKTDAMTCPVQF